MVVQVEDCTFADVDKQADVFAASVTAIALAGIQCERNGKRRYIL